MSQPFEGAPNPQNQHPLAQAEQVINDAVAMEVPQVSGAAEHPFVQVEDAFQEPEVAQRAFGEVAHIAGEKLSGLMASRDGARAGRRDALHERAARRNFTQQALGARAVSSSSGRGGRPGQTHLSRWGTQRIDEMRNIGAHTDTEQR